jgi:two-component system sensor histidine kinase/response regulator
MAEGSQPPMRPTILVIEDSQNLRNDIINMLSSEGFQVIAAENGQKGVKLAKEELPDLIVCDIRMPILDGYDVLTAVRTHPTIMNTPFIFLTARAGREDVREGMKLGADDYLTKPFTADELLTAITSQLDRQKRVRLDAERKLNELRRSIALALPHELRTPLNAVLGFSELLIMDVEVLEKDQVLEMAGHIHIAAQRLYRLIENYVIYTNLEVIKSDENRLQRLRMGRTPDPGVLTAQTAERKARDYEREADLSLDIHPTTRTTAIDPDNFARIILELIDNAFKFSKPGGRVHLSLRAVDHMLQIIITDEGWGMTLEQIRSIGGYMQFDRSFFEQQGIGFGLTIARSMTEVHGGTFEIDSVPNEFTRVFIYLPLTED